MKFQEILLISSALFVFINAENKDNKHEHHLHEKSYQNKPQEKSHNRYHILNRHKQSETENQRNHHFQKLVYRDGNQNYSNDANGKPAPNSLGLQIDYNAIAGLIGVVNKSSNTALILDSHNVAAILNGQSGVITIVDIHLSVIYRISNAQENGISLKSGFDVYFQNLSSLQDLLNIGQQCQQKYNFSNISPSVLNEMSSDLGSLGGLNSLDGLKQTSLFTSELKGSLAFLYKGKGTFKIFKSLQWFVGLNFAFAKLFDNTQGSLQSEKLDLGAVFGASSIIEALLNLLSQIAKYEDLSKLLRSCLSSPEKWLNVIADASKASNDGVDGLITVLSNIIDVFRGKGSVSTVINSLINYNPHSDGNSFNLSQIINQALDIIQRQNELFNNFSAFEVIFNILKDLNNNNFIWNSVNIRDVIKLLEFENPREVIQTIVKIISQGIPHIIDYLKNIPDYGNIVQTVLRQANFSQIFTNDFNPTSFLSKLPVIGNVLRQIFTSLVNSNPISQGFNNILGSNLTHGVFGNIGGSIINGTSEIGSGIEHGISSFLGTITSGFLGADSGNGGTSESPSKNFATISDSISNFIGGLGKNDSSTYGNIGTSESSFRNSATSDSVSNSTGGLEKIESSTYGYMSTPLSSTPGSTSKGPEFLETSSVTGRILNRKRKAHGHHNLHEKKENKLHHKEKREKEKKQHEKHYHH